MFYVDIQYSKNGGHTWSKWRKLPMGELGDFCKRVVARRFGSSRQFVFRTRVTDDCRADLISASVQMTPGSQ